MKQNFHHGDLRAALLENGLLLLNEVGVSNFSLRKVAARCGVSHTAPYKHFENKEALLQGITDEVKWKFAAALKQQAENAQRDFTKNSIELGISYVVFMVENPEYFKFLFLNKSVSQIHYENGQFLPSEELAFEVFKKSARALFEQFDIPKEQEGINILTMWSLVHGFALLLIKENVVFDQPYEEVLFQILTQKLRFD
ncbi:MAG: TetR/AcrR family transcriptional regulator [Bacilli bacterium]